MWQYRDPDPDLGHQQANELSNQLKVILSGFRVSITAGKGYVEVKPQGIEKVRTRWSYLGRICAKTDQEKNEEL